MTAMRIYTIGHSNQTLEVFVHLLAEHDIEVLVDVRSAPISSYAPHFNQKELASAFPEVGVKYLYMGHELGGRPEVSDFYDARRRVLYDQVAQSSDFRQGIERLKQGVQQYRIAIMCSEEDPSNCHRRLLVGRVLAMEGMEVSHIRGDGALQTEADLVTLEQSTTKREPQLTLFESAGEYRAWRSTKPIPSASPRGARRTSLKR